jgi:hypothetical protein
MIIGGMGVAAGGPGGVCATTDFVSSWQAIPSAKRSARVTCARPHSGRGDGGPVAHADKNAAQRGMIVATARTSPRFRPYPSAARRWQRLIGRAICVCHFTSARAPRY